MNKILKEKLIKIKKDLEAERLELRTAFMGVSTIKKNWIELREEYENEERLLAKYNKNRISAIEYIVDLDFALEDLELILIHH